MAIEADEVPLESRTVRFEELNAVKLQEAERFGECEAKGSETEKD